MRRLARDGMRRSRKRLPRLIRAFRSSARLSGHGVPSIFGRVEGEVHASTVVIAEGAEMVGDVVAEELTVGVIRANRVRLNGTGVVEGDIFHRTLAIEENASCEGTSRRNENAIDTRSRVQTAPKTQVVSIDGNGKGNGTSEDRPAVTRHYPSSW
jgi:cytoskeletal protein CcmA (bactofilin family)